MAKMMPKMGPFKPRLELEIGPRQKVAVCPEFSEILGKSCVIHVSPEITLFNS